MLQRSLIVVTLPPRDTTGREIPVLENVRMCILCTNTSVSGQDLGSDRVGLLRLNYLIVEGATRFDDIDIICPESIELS